MAKLGDLVARIGADTKGFNQALGDVERRSRQMSGNIKNLGKQMSMAITLPIAALGVTAVNAFDKQAKAIAQVEAGLKSTGDQVGYTSKQLQDMASEMQKTTLFGDEAILKDATAQLLTFTNISGNEFKRTQKAALDLATRLDGDLKSASIQLGKALNDPVKNLSALSRSGIQFSNEQKTLINSLAETGQMAEAQRIILAELEKQYGGSAEAAAAAGLGPMQQLANSFGDLQEQFGEIILEFSVPLVDFFKRVVAAMQEMSPTTKKIILAITGFAAAIGPVLYILPQMVAGFNLVKAAMIKGVIPALKRLYATLLANPYLAVIAAVGALVMALHSFYNKQNDVHEATEQANAALKEQSAILQQAVKGAAAEKSINALRQSISALNEEIDNINPEGLAKAISLDKMGVKTTINIEKGLINPSTEKQIKDELFKSLNELTYEAAEKGLFGADATAYINKRAKSLAQEIITENKNALLARRDELQKALNEATAVEAPQVNANSGSQKSAPAVRVPISIEPIDPIAVAQAVNDIPVPDLVISPTIELSDEDQNKLTKFKEQGQNVANAVSGAFTQMGQKIVDGLGLADDGFEGFKKSLAGTVIELMGMYLSQSISAAIAGGANAGAATGPAAPVTTPAYIATLVGGVLSAFAAIPAFADGGVVSGPTMGLMGEYSGARNNPEVIAPLDKLRGMIADVSGGGNNGGVLSTKVKGSDLVFILERGQKQVNRNR